MRQGLLEEIADLLQENATNYSVFLQAYEVPFVGGETASAIIHNGLGVEAVLGGIDDVDVDTVWAEVADALLFPGDDGAGPDGAKLMSESFIALIDELREALLQLAAASKKIQRFWLQDGHPAYPVFWDFAFLFWEAGKATIVIGSSSD